MTTFKTKLQCRVDEESNWTSKNPTLLNGELGISTETINGSTNFKGIKVGKGLSWSDTNYLPFVSVDDVFDNIEDSSDITLAYNTITKKYYFDYVGVSGVNADWNATSGLAEILNKPSIPAAQVNSDWNSSSGLSQILNKPSTITTDITPTQQALLSTTANWSTPTASSVSYYIGATALSGNKQGQFYFDGLYLFLFIADDYPIRLSGNLHGILIQNGTILNAALETALQNKITAANEPSVTLKINPDFNTSDDIEIKGIIYDVTEDRMADDGSVPTAGTYTYSWRDSTSATWTTGVSLATLKTRLTGHTTSTITIVKATNTTTTVLNRVRLNLKRYL